VTTQRSMALAAAIFMMSAVAPGAYAQTAAAPVKLEPHVIIKTADGRRVGYIEAIDTDHQGTQTAAQVIYDSRIIHIPASTISAVDKNHYTTSLTTKDLDQL
jgi:hypothetical protein